MMNTEQDGLILPVAVKSIIPLANIYLLLKGLRERLFKHSQFPHIIGFIYGFLFSSVVCLFISQYYTILVETLEILNI